MEVYYQETNVQYSSNKEPILTQGKDDSAVHSYTRYVLSISLFWLWWQHTGVKTDQKNLNFVFMKLCFLVEC